MNRLSTPSTASHRRWARRKARPLVSLSEVVVWLTWLIITLAVLLAGCLMLTIVFGPTP